MAREFTDDTVQLATRIPKALHIRTRVAALDQGVTLATWVGDALSDHLARCKREHRSGALKVAKQGKETPSDAA